jgi:hypothetical protein
VLAIAPAAIAATLSLACTEYQNSTNPSGCTTGVVPEVLSTPGIYSYGDTQLLPASSTDGVITGSSYPAGYAGASFYDAFVFTLTSSNGDAISSTIDLPPNFQISGFEERLYSYTGTAPIIGPVSDAYNFWTMPTGSGGTAAVLPETVLPAGTYVLEVRGDVTGTTGGGYSGTFELQPVPLPPALTLALSGFALLLMLRFRRREDPQAVAA